MRDNRRYQRLYARRKYERKHAGMRLDALATGHCPVRLGVSVCNGRLQAETDGNGELVARCEWCERRARGACRVCGQPVKGAVRRALYCALHKKLATHESMRRWISAHRSELREKAREYASRPEVRDRRLRYKKLYREARPTKIAQYKREYAEKHREKVNAYHRKYYRKTKRQMLKSYTRDGDKVLRRYAKGERPCWNTCGNVVTGRAKKCEPCKRAAFVSSRQTIAREYAA